MTFMHKLSRRLAQNDLLPLVALLLVPACAGEPASVQYDVSAIHVSPRSVVLAPNDAYQFTAMGDATGLQEVPVPVLWTAEGGVIDEDGRFVAGNTDGTYRVFATHATLQWLVDTSTAIVLSAGPPVGVRVQPRGVTVAVSETVTLTAYALYPAGDSTPTAAEWSADGGSVTTVNGLGVFQSGQAGEFTVRAQVDTLADTVTVTVTQAAVASVSVAPTADTLTVGTGLDLVAVARDADGNPLTSRQFIWTSGNPTVASVSPAGRVTARAAGSATITVTCEGRSAAATILVQAPPPAPVASVTLTPDSTSLLIGNRIQLTAVARDASGNTLTGRAFAWSVANGSVASVSSTGEVTALGIGVTTVTVACEGRTDAATIVGVTPPPPPPPPPGTGVPVFDPKVHTMLVEDTFDGWSSFNRSAVPGPKLQVMNNSATGTGNPAATVKFIGGRGGAGQAVQITYPTQIGDAQSRHYVATAGVSTGVNVTTYQEVWMRTSPGASNDGYSPKWLQHWHAPVGGTERIQISSFKFGSSSPDLGGLPAGDYFHINSLENSLAMARNGPRWRDINDGQWHQYTTAVRPNSAPGARDGVVRLWIDGVLVVDLSAAGVLAGRTDTSELDQLAYGVAIGNIHVGELMWLGTVPTWTLDVDDFRRWRDQ